MSNQPSRRDRVHAATLAEIRETARQVLVEQGVEGLSLRAIAREMGLTAPALYRYFASREDLIEDLIADLYDELSGTLELARDREPPDDIGGRLLAASREFRSWALAHPREFALMFGSPVPGVFTEGPEDEQSRMHHAGLRFGAVFGTLIAQLYQTHRFPVPADEEIDPVLRQQLAAWCTGFPIPLPLGVAQIFMSCWIRIYGLVCMEVFGHLDFALSDAEPMFETELRDLARLLDLAHEYRPPARRPSAIQGGPGRPPPE
jgi:AcrR family transcriptional regulator